MRRLGQSEVENLHPAVARDKDILRIQIAIGDSLFMRRQATRHLFRVFRGFAYRQLAEVVNGGDGEMIQCRDRLSLLLKTPKPAGAAGESCRQDLDYDLAVEPRIGARYTSPMPPP
jgi:hypothetical protein